MREPYPSQIMGATLEGVFHSCFRPRLTLKTEQSPFYVNKDTMRVADIRASEDYLIMKANESSEGRLFLSKYSSADVYAGLGHRHPDVTFSVSDSLYSLSMFVNMTYTGDVTGVSASCTGHYGSVKRITSNVMAYIEEASCVPTH